MQESPGKMYALAVAMTLLAAIAVGLRFYSRYVKKAGFSWDDWTILPALVWKPQPSNRTPLWRCLGSSCMQTGEVLTEDDQLMNIIIAISIIVGSAKGDLARHTELITVYDDDGVGWPFPNFTDRTVVFLKVTFIVMLIQVPALGFTRLSVLFFYRRIFQGPWIHNTVWFMIGINFLWTVGFFFSNLLQCYPISVNWSGFGNSEGKCMDVNLFSKLQAWTDVAMNVSILALPLPCVRLAAHFATSPLVDTSQIWALKMPLVKKLAVGGIFLLGALTVFAGIVKGYLLQDFLDHNDPDKEYIVLDLSYYTAPLNYYPLVEITMGIIGACLPLYRPLFAGVTSRGFMRDLQSVDVPTTEQSKTLWNNPDDSRAVEEWNSSMSTIRYGSDSQSSFMKEKGLPSLPASSLKMLSNAPSEGPWKKGPKVYHTMV
ncbi:MAG: hypothetical protein Q9192_005918 [Flavoplaca navasiana]